MLKWKHQVELQETVFHFFWRFRDQITSWLLEKTVVRSINNENNGEHPLKWLFITLRGFGGSGLKTVAVSQSGDEKPNKTGSGYETESLAHFNKMQLASFY